jgi:F0F1-type ATP synthase assembly protein I
MSERDQQHLWQLAARYSALGIEMVAAVALGTGAGVWADRHFGASPLFLIFGLVVGVGAAIRAVIHIIHMAKTDKLDQS